MLTKRIYGPIVSTDNLESHISIFRDVHGMEVLATQSFSEQACGSLWGTKNTSAKAVWLHTPGVPFGVYVVQFTPPAEQAIREGHNGYGADALKVIDFYAPDFEAGVRHLEKCGYALESEVAAYELPHGKFQEGHFWGPDSVICAIISGPGDFFKDFATVTDQPFSEPQSISSPVSDREAVIDFFDKIFDLKIIHEYSINDESFSKLVGDEKQITIKAANIGIKTTEPYFGIIHYGLPPGDIVSMRGKTKPPARGLIGGLLEVEDIRELEHRLESNPQAALTGVTESTLEPFGSVACMLVAVPNGANLLAFQRL